jgi:hypothetical protein
LTLSPVDLLRNVFRRAVRLVLTPTAEWRAIGSEPTVAWPVLGSFVLLLACVPAIAWSLNLWLFGGEGGRDAERATIGLEQVLGAGLMLWVFAVLSVLVLASSIWILAPLFIRGRDWPRALTIAGYSAAPVFLGGVLLAAPDVAYTVLLAVFHACYLLYVGLRSVLSVKEDNAAEFVALSIVIFIVATTFLGSASSALGLL